MLDHPLVRRLAPFAAWSAIALLAILSLLPKEDMVRTGADSRFEHFIAYAGTMGLCAIAYAWRVGTLRPALALIAYAGALELGQHFAPGRTPGLFDFAAGMAGVVAGALAYAAIRRR